jgi:alpha-glucosidase
VFGEFSELAERSGCYAAPDEGLHSGYSFPMLLQRKLDPKFFRDYFALLAKHPAHWPCISFSNHDVMRTVSRFGGRNPPPGLAKMLLALLFSLKGTVLMYQGEELGLPEADLRRDQLRDPVGDLYYPQHKGRDGCRTPMPWDASAPNLGFTNGTPWLPLSPDHAILAVSEQEHLPFSTLAFSRHALAARRSCEALRCGDIQMIDVPTPLLAFYRVTPNERVLAVFNMSEGIQEFWLGAPLPKHPLFATVEARTEDMFLKLGRYAAWVGQI